MSGAVAAKLGVPFMGLRFFDERQANLFFGRDDQVHDLLRTLEQSRFVTVLGSSGSGKSSLVRAGLIPALCSGLSSETPGAWRIAKTQPGGAPIRLLAGALEKTFACTGLELTLRRGPLGLIEAAMQARQGENENLLVLVDQFEEIFRFQREGREGSAARDEAVAFVKLLLEAAAAHSRPIRVVLTMRSEYLGNCSDFRDLPERINQGLYLIPRMTRDQLEEAIRGPLALFDTAITGRLVQRLLNDVGEVMDQLPVLQHALLRTWLRWRAEDDAGNPVDIGHYEAAGGLREGLSRHADEIYEHLEKPQRRIAETLFRCLTEKDPRNRDIRRPTALGVIAGVASAEPGAVIEVVEIFRAEGTAFLMPPPTTALDEGRTLDITHESLIRQWSKLCGDAENKGWVQDEAELRDRYRELATRARRRKTEQDLLFGGDLDTALLWRSSGVNSKWAERHDSDDMPGGFALVESYIADSVELRDRQRQEEREQREREQQLSRANRNRKIYGGISMVLVVLLGIAVWSFVRSERSRRQEETLRKESESLRKLAEQKTDIASKQTELALVESSNAKKATAEAKHQKAVAEELRVKAEKFRELATARQLASQADAMRSDLGQVELRALLALESLKRAPLEVGVRALAEPLSLMAKPVFTRKINAGDDGFAAALSKDLQLIASTNGKKLTIMRLSDAAIVRQLDLPAPVDDLAWDGDKINLNSQMGEAGRTTFYSVDAGSGRTTRLLEFKGVEDVVWTEDGRYVAVNLAGDGGSGRVYELPGFTEVTEYAGSRRISALAPGARFVVREKPPTRALANIEIVSRKGVVAELRRSQQCRFDRLGLFAACTEAENRIRVYSSEGKPVGVVSLRASSEIAGLDETRLASKDETGAVSIRNWQTGDVLAVWAEQSELLALAFAQDGSAATTIGDDGTVRRMDLNIARAAAVVPLSSTRQSFVLDASGRWLTSGPTARESLIDFRSGKLFAGGRRYMAISPDGKYVTSIESSKTIRVLDVAGKPVGLVSLRVPVSATASSVAVGPEARFVAAAAVKGGLWIYDVQASGEDAARQVFTGRATRPAFSPDGKYLAFFNADEEPAVVVLECAKWTRVFGVRVSTTSAASTFSPDGRFLAVRAYGNLREIDDEEEKRESRVTSGAGVRIVAVPSGTEVWKVELRRPVVPTPVFSPDSRLMAYPSAGEQVRVLDLRTRRENPPVPVSGAVSRLAFSQSGELLAAGGPGSVGVYSVKERAFLGSVLAPEESRIVAFQFTDRDKELRLASTSEKGLTIRNQLYSVGAAVVEGCSAVSRNLTRSEWKRYLPDEPTYRKTCPAIAAGE